MSSQKTNFTVYQEIKKKDAKFKAVDVIYIKQKNKKKSTDKRKLKL